VLRHVRPVIKLETRSACHARAAGVPVFCGRSNPLGLGFACNTRASQPGRRSALSFNGNLIVASHARSDRTAP
jgi:hypothetical protein